MYYLLGRAFCGRLIERVADPGGEDSAAGVPLKRLYNRYLSRTQGLPASDSAETVWVDDPRLEAELLAFVGGSPLNDLARYRDPRFLEVNGDRAAVRADLDHVRAAVRAFASQDPGFWRFFELAVNYVLCPKTAYSTRGGTSSKAIGVIYACEPRARTERDLYEFLVHELAHSTMFLFEDKFGLFDYELIVREENYSPAVLSGQRRPIDKAVHSIAVSTEVVLHRREVTGDPDQAFHGRTGDLVERTLHAIDAIGAMPNRAALLTEPALWLMERCRTALGAVGAPA